MDHSRRTRYSPQRVWESVASRVVHGVERVFFQLGKRVAVRPWLTIALTWIFIGLSCLGFLRFHHEKNPMKLWVPPDSDFYADTDWYMTNFQSGFRIQSVLVTADNVLEPEIILKLSEINEKVESIRVHEDNQTYTLRDLCFKVPKISLDGSSRNVRNVRSTDDMLKGQLSFNNDFFTEDKTVPKTQEKEFDPSVFLSTDFYCNIISSFTSDCFQKNILDLWQYDQNVIRNMTRENILNSINSTTFSPTTGHPMNYSSLLGQIERDSTGKIISAKSIITTWFTHVDFATANIDEVGNLVGTEDWVSLKTLRWEKKFLDLIETFAENCTSVSMYYQAGRSFGDISGATMFQEIDKLFMGIALMFIYIQVVMSGYSCLEIRLTLGSVGLLCVGMAYITGCGWCSLFGIPYGPVHASLPFLLMGLGIDDMFVMKACWEELTADERRKPLPVQVGLMLQHAGVSIVITSFTDIVAFLIGSITILPSLRSFCFYAAFGVFFIFCFSVTFYVAVFTLDVLRINANRNGLLFCYKHTREIKLKEGNTLFQRMFSAMYRNFIFTVPVKVIVIAFTVAMTAFSIESVLRLEQRFDPDWFIPDDTYFKQFLDQHKYYYPDDGQFGFVFLGKMNYSKELPNLYEMAQNLRNESYVTDLSTWVEGLHDYVSQNYVDNFTYSNLSPEDFDKYLSKFLFSPSGGRFQQNFKFMGDLICGQPIPNITASSFQFRFTRFEGPIEYIPAMNKLKDIVKSTNITSGDGYRSVWSKVFANWVTDEVIAVEVERNVELALVCVMACTVILITDLQMCIWIFICVLLTLINVCGWMQRWGMTIDIVSCIGLELAIGLCVDYAAHVGHTFLTISEGSRPARSLKTVTSIGTAVLYGGGSTLLSLSVLSMSKAYTFNSFFKIFFLVIMFGLFHGLVFLPIVLSLIGPRAYRQVKKRDKIADVTEMEAVELNGKKLPECDDDNN